MFAKGNVKLLGYAMDVLVPEAVVRLHMSHFNVDYKKAEELMHTCGYMSTSHHTCEEEEESDEVLGMAINPTKKRKLLEISRRFTSEVERALDSTEDSPLSTPCSNSLEGSSSRHLGESGSAATLLSRGRELQLKQKHLFGDNKKGKGPLPKSRNIPVSVCKMKKGRAGTYVRDGMSIEIIANVHDNCDDIIFKAQSAFHMKRRKGEVLALFTLSGACIQATSEWTLHEYLKKTHKSEAKLGIGYIEEFEEEEEEHSEGSGSGSSSELPRISVTESGNDGMQHGEKLEPIVVPGDDTGYSGATVSYSHNESSTSVAPKKCLEIVKIDDARSSRQPTVTVKEGKCMQFASVELANATKDYNRKNLLGKGGFGSVYKGCLGGGLAAAIKILSQEGQQALFKSTGSQLQTEVDALTRFRHPNIVTMYGCCPKPPALIYELMESSLFDRLHNVKEDQSVLSWEQRLSILKDTCRGLHYLHSAKPPLVHQDIKSANILLDKNMTAKLADFGFAIELPRVTHGKTMFTVPFVARSEGYYPSEVTTGHFSDKSDVFSYGMVVLETYTGLKVYDSKREDKKLVNEYGGTLLIY